jgi:signal transduction histidine kinase
VAESLTPTERFSINSHAMLALRDMVLGVWEAQLRARLSPTKGLSRPVLIDTMPVLYERLSSILTPAYFARDGVDVVSIAAEHGVERADLTEFDAETVLAEFLIFRSVLFDTLDAHGVPLTGPERRAMHLTIDEAVRESMRAFVASTNALRERFAGALAHDLRQPLSHILLAADLILHQAPPPGVADWVRRIVRNGERMTAMLGELLDALALQAGDKPRFALEECDLLALAQGVGARAHDSQGLEVNVAGVPVVGWWNPTALERALDNLLDNARKYGTPGAAVEVTVSANNGRAVLAVRNQGAPIPADAHEAIFQPIVRAPDAAGSATGGWGIGLPYVRSVAHGHGGSAVVYSDAEAGTVFVVDIPVDARPFQEGEQTNAP